MEPAVKFNPERARVIIEKVLHEKFDGHKYPPITHPEITKHLSAEIREKMKNLKVDRYKLVCVVTMGQKVDCSIMIASRCLSDASVDTFASYTYENMELFATAIVYAFYFE
jgi:X breakpoint 2-interacting protein